MYQLAYPGAPLPKRPSEAPRTDRRTLVQKTPSCLKSVPISVRFTNQRSVYQLAYPGTQAAAFYKLPIQLEPLRAIIARNRKLLIQLFGNCLFTTRTIAIQHFGNCRFNSLLCARPRIGMIFACFASFSH